MENDNTPDLIFDDQGNPRSRRFDDLYFQADAGPAESEFVFVKGCNLPQGWQKARRFVIGETGFGSGLNFLLAWSAWRATCKPDQRLHFVSAERYPLDLAQLARVHELWPVLAPLASRLRRHYPLQTPGFHRLHLSRSVTLSLMFGDALACLEQLEATVDVWFLDGFAPSRNPAMWSRALLAQVARLSAHGARLATFTAAGQVRRDLTAVGYEVSRGPGYGAKRERLLGRFSGNPATACPLWFTPPATVGTADRIGIAGAGIAGTVVQQALGRRGIDALVMAGDPGASAIPAATVMPRLEAGDGVAGRFFWQAWRYALAYWEANAAWEGCGALLLDRRDGKRHQAIARIWSKAGGALCYLDSGAAAQKAGLGLTRGGLWFGDAGVVRGLAALENVGPQVCAVKSGGANWLLSNRSGQQTVSHLVLCTGAAAPLIGHALPLQNWYGLTLKLPTTESSAALRCALHGGGYVLPAAQGGHWSGATFEAADQSSSRLEGQGLLMSKLQTSFPELALATSPAGHWSGTRSATPDRLPVAGPVAQPRDSRHALGWLRHGRPVPGRDQGPSWYPGLWLVGALGARGYTSAPLLGEWLASMMTGDPWPIPRDMALALCTSRFIARDLKRSGGHPTALQ